MVYKYDNLGYRDNCPGCQELAKECNSLNSQLADAKRSPKMVWKQRPLFDPNGNPKIGFLYASIQVVASIIAGIAAIAGEIPASGRAAVACLVAWLLSFERTEAEE